MDRCTRFHNVTEIMLQTALNIKKSFHLTLSRTSPFFTCLHYKSFENTLGKREIACEKQFLLFPHCFLPFWENFQPFLSNSKLSCANSFSLEESKISVWKRVYSFPLDKILLLSKRKPFHITYQACASFNINSCLSKCSFI